MKVTAMNGVKVYTVSGHRQFASWLPPNKKRALRKDQGQPQFPPLASMLFTSPSTFESFRVVGSFGRSLHPR
jgi:hypothetical protein